MSEFASLGCGMEKLNEHNYREWKSCIKSYLRGQDLWEIVDGSETSPPPKDDKTYKVWDVKAGKALFALKVSIDKSLLARIEDVDTPKEAWDILAALFSKKNTARLQLLENELMSTMQGTLSISDYFYKVKNLCREIEQLDADAKFGDDRVRRIIINGLKPEYNSFIAAIQGWPTQPSLVELENLLANQEALVKQMTIVTLRQENEEALYSVGTRSRYRDKGRSGQYEKRRERKEERVDDADSKEHEDEDHHRRSWKPRGKCFNCGREGHYARDCRSETKVHGNFAKENHAGDETEEEWDFETPHDMANYCEDCPVEEGWDISGLNHGEVWIEDLDEGESFEVAASSIICEGDTQGEHEEGLTGVRVEQGGSGEKRSETVKDHEEQALDATPA